MAQPSNMSQMNEITSIGMQAHILKYTFPYITYAYNLGTRESEEEAVDNKKKKRQQKPCH